MNMRKSIIGMALAAVTGIAAVSAQEQIIRVDLAYRAPGNGPAPNFSPYGTQVTLTTLTSGASLPEGATLPAKSGTMKIGPNQHSWMPVLVTSDAAHPKDFCRLFVDRNRDGNFADDGPAVMATPAQNDKTKAWWSSFNKIEVSVPYGNNVTEPYLVNFWTVREDTAAAPDVVRYSVGSWRYGTVTVNHVSALVAAMDADNDAVFGPKDRWSVLEASAPNAERAVLSANEARETSLFMFIEDGAHEVVLEFRSFSPDGRTIDFAVVNKPVTKAGDRAPDDLVGAERTRPRTKTPFAWGHNFDEAVAKAKAAHKRVLVDFEATWCGPCKSMDEWIWNDAEVASLLNTGYVGVKLDGDIEKALVKRYNVSGYPTMVILDATAKESKRLVGYQTSKDIIAAVK
jgi:thiol-disulfide isomerase/thioredoxin